ncbi:hypothetical protein AB0H83_07165 [Dactylosporangium sp. NPDC050688]|uniref:hypothetical protein n=1 Tax=Dactylosporangium sp. NPDC050688 TaxID=3157217 RepID=UPI0033CD5E83
MSASLAVLVWSFLDEPLRLDPADLGRERSTNSVWFNISDEPVDAPAVAAALDGVGRELRARFAGASGPVTFYAWYDEQAGQLRCTMRSVDPGALPFVGRYVAVDRPDPVVALLAAAEHPGLVPWGRLTGTTADAADADPEPFPVFAVTITAS